MGIKIKKREGKSRRKVLLFGKQFTLPAIEENISGGFVVDSLFSAHFVRKNSSRIKYDRIYNIAKAHLPNDASSEFLIIDPIGLINDVGLQSLCIKELTDRQTKYFLKRVTSPWLQKVTMTKIYQAEPTINPLKFFKKYGNKWNKILLCWTTEGLLKDERLLNGFKASIPPFFGSPTHWQPYNPHQIWLTNTGTGKSMFNIIAGNQLNVDISVAGLFGGNIDNYSQQIKGSLSGHGMFLIDEIEQLAHNEYSREIVTQLLTYMEQGVVSRRLKVPIVCEGTKTLIFASNPPTSDMIQSLATFNFLLQGQGDPTRLGRRIGLFLFGNDFKRVEPANPITALRDPIRRLIQLTFLKYKNKYEKTLIHFKPWIEDRQKNHRDFQHTIQSLSRQSPDETCSKFIQGLSYSLIRLRTASLKINILNHLNLLATEKLSTFWRTIEENLEPTLETLYTANIRSIVNLTIAEETIQPDKETALKIKQQFPSLSTKQIANLLKVDKSTISRWLNE